MEKEITERIESANENLRAGTKTPTRSQPLSGIQRTLGNEAMGRLLGARVVQAKLRVSQPGDADENEADAVAERVMSRQSSGVVQRKCECGGSCAKCQEEQEEGGVIHRSAVGGMRWVPLSIQRAEAEEGESKPRRDQSRHPHGHPQVVVEDEAEKVETGQMRKKQFLELLQTTSCATADAALEAVGHTTKGCPYIRKWLAHYREESAVHLVSAMHKYAPETRKARSAHEAISQLNRRVERAAVSWAKTGKVSGLPEGMQAEMLGAEGGEGKSALSKFASSGFGKGLLGFLGGKGGEEAEISFGGKEKKKETGEIHKKAKGAETGATTQDATAVREQLGSGQSLDSRVQGQMSRAFGYDFSGVRVHTDAKAGELSTQLNARAFTIGSDVAFAGGDYQPGTPIGDALIAHELAHVVQQGGGKQSTEPKAKDASFADNSQLEQDADRSAVGAVLSAWLGAGKDAVKLGATALPRLRSGLRLQSCSKKETQESKKEPEKSKADEFREQLGATPEQKSAIAILFSNTAFLSLWEYLKNCSATPKKDLGPLGLKVTPGLKIRGKERYGGYSPGSRTLEINPTKPEHKANPAELVDTITHELIHAVFDLAPECKKAGSGDPPLAGGATLNLPSRQDVAGTQEEKRLMQDPGPGASDPCGEFIDINAAAQRMVIQIIRQNIQVAKVGRPTITFVNEILRRNPAAMKAYTDCRDLACAKDKPEERQSAMAVCSADIINRFMPPDLSP